MRIFTLISAFTLLMASCSNNNNQADTAQLFCDTACTQDTFLFKGNHKLKPFVAVSVENCLGDTLTWSHDALPTQRQMHLGTLLKKQVRLNQSAINCYIKDTSHAWLSFNDCITGQGYLFKLPYNKKESISKMAGAINSFDKKFVVPDDLRAYADYSTIYVVDVNTNKTEMMTFKERYDTDFTNIHKTIDSVNLSRNRIFVQLIKNGEKVQLEKQINL